MEGEEVSILIEGMEMPKENDYTIAIVYGDGVVTEYHEDYWIRGADGEKQFGTAAPVPPHGDLIDRDALIARYEAQRAEDRDILCDERAFPSDYEKAQYRYSRNSDFISALKSQAAIIPADEGET